MVREIIVLASRFNADVSIEKLARFKPKGRTFNKKVSTIPSYIFRRILEARCFDSGITLNRINPYHTPNGVRAAVLSRRVEDMMERTIPCSDAKSAAL